MIAQLFRWRIHLAVAVATCAGFAGVIVGIYGVEKVVAKGVEFVAHELSPSSFVGRQRYLAIIAVLLIGEILLVGYRNSTVYRFLHPSKSTRIDLYAFLVRMTGLGAILMALVSFGATEWFPMLLRRVAHVEPLDLFANAWLAVGVYHLVYSFGEYWLHRWAHSCEWLWEVHNFHHSAAEMNMITTGRLHPFERAIDDVVLALPLMLFGVNAFVPALVFTIARTVHNLLAVLPPRSSFDPSGALQRELRRPLRLLGLDVRDAIHRLARGRPRRSARRSLREPGLRARVGPFDGSLLRGPRKEHLPRCPPRAAGENDGRQPGRRVRNHAVRPAKSGLRTRRHGTLDERTLPLPTSLAISALSSRTGSGPPFFQSCSQHTMRSQPRRSRP
jgi:hypothetical protein